MRTFIVTIWMLAAAELPADTFTTLVASGSGWYDPGTGHQTGTYVAGWEGLLPDEYRSYFAFNLAGLSGIIDSATLSLYVSGYQSQDSSETLGIFDVSTLIPDLESGTFAYADLGTGVLFGSAAISLSNIGTRITIDFNADGVAALNAGQNEIAFGGAITTLANTFDFSNELVYGPGALGDFPPYLIVGSKVPEPATVYLLLTVLAGVTTASRFRRARRL